MPQANNVADQVSSLKRELARTHQCSESAVQLLRSLLVAGDDAGPKRPAQSGPVQASAASRLKDSSNVSRSKHEAKRDAHVSNNFLSASERKRLIVDVVNVCLNVLSNALTKQKPSASEPVTLKQRKHDISTQPTDEQRISLMECSSNVQPRINRTRFKSYDTKKHTAKAAKGDINYVVSCCHIALCNLGNSTRLSTDLLFENASITFIRKLTSLGYLDTATEQATTLRSRLECVVLGRERRVAALVCAKGKTPMENISSALMDFAAIPEDTQLLKVLIGHQMLVMQIIALKEDRGLAEEVVKCLRTDVASSLFNLIDCYAAFTSDAQTASMQFDTLAKSISAISQSVQNRINEVSEIKSSTCFQLQTFSLQAKFRSMKHSKCMICKATAIWQPFARAASSYNKSSEDFVQKYTTALHCYKVLENVYEECPCSTCSRKAHILAVCDVNITLGNMAQASGASEDAMMWITECKRNLKNVMTTSTEGARITARLMSLILDQARAGNDFAFDFSLEDPTYIFNFEPAKYTEDRDALLRAATALQSSTCRYLQAKSTVFGGDNAEHYEGCATSCREVIEAGYSWLIRMWESLPQVVPMAAEESISMQYLWRASRLCFEYAVKQCFCLNSTVIKAADLEHWKHNLDKCCSLVQFLTSDISTSTRISVTAYKDPRACFKSLSDAYYRLHVLGMLEMQAIATESLAASCALLEQTSEEAKANSHLSLKLSRLGQIYLNLGRSDDAVQSWLRCVKVEVAIGRWKETLESRDLPNLCNNDLIQESVEKLLTTDLRGHCNVLDSRKYLSDMPVTKIERASLLVQQLRIMSSWTRSTTLRMHLKTMLSEIIPISLQLIRDCGSGQLSLSLHLMILKIAMDAPEYLEDKLRDRIMDIINPGLEASKSQSKSSCFASEYYKASIICVQFILGEPVTIAHLHSACERWEDLLGQDGITNPGLHDYELRSWSKIASRLANLCRLKGLMQITVSSFRTLSLLKRIIGPDTEEDEWPAEVEAVIQLLRLGYSEDARIQLDQLKTRIQDENSLAPQSISYRIACAEYFLAVEDLSSCREHLDHIYTNLVVRDVANCRDTAKRQALYSIMLVDYHNLESHYQATKGQHIDASFHARIQIQHLQRLWKCSDAGETRVTKTNGFDSHDLDQKLARLNLSNNKVSTHASVPSQSAMQMLVGSRLIRAFQNLARLLQWSGEYDEAMCHLGQAERIATSIIATSSLGGVLVQMGKCSIHECSVGKGRSYLSKAEQLYAELETTKDFIDLQLALGHLHRVKKEWSAEALSYERAQATIKSLTDYDFVSSICKHHSSTKMGKVNNDHGEASSDTHPMKSRSISRQTGHKSNKEKPGHSPHANNPIYMQFSALEAELACSKIQTSLAQRDIKACEDVLLITRTAGIPQALQITLNLLRSQLVACTSHSLMAEDPVISMLTESTLSIPAVVQNTSMRHKVAATNEVRNNVSKKKIDGASAVGVSDVAQKVTQELREALRIIALDDTSSVAMAAQKSLHRCLTCLASLSLELSYIDHHPVSAEAQPSSSIAVQFNSPQILASFSERCIAYADFVFKESPVAQQNSIAPSFGNDLYTIAARVQSETLAMLPKSWTIVSISLEQANGQLHLVKYQAERSPFVVRIPLDRQMEGLEDQSYSFDEARAELDDIIRESDSTVQSGRENPDQFSISEARSGWWAKRTELDCRLRDLLLNIENMWFGGFRGIFSHTVQNKSLAARFKQSLENILGKYLPSRQKASKHEMNNKTQLDRRVIELFIGLGNAAEQDSDLGEALTDLLYYVVDILQFNGEPNAYDEINFDATIVEIQSALQSYHEAVESTLKDSEPQHVILVLDSGLHAFPWESMPCLGDRSVSRVHSLTEIHERLLLMQQQSTSSTSKPSTLTATKTNGTYILNPSQDLSRTQTRFEHLLSTLSETKSWSPIIATQPTSNQFLASLSNNVESAFDPTREPNRSPQPTTHDISKNKQKNRILLYFGHGSGFQYLKHRHVKALRYKHLLPISANSPLSNSKPPQMNPSISIPLLFGCSSASLTLHGEYNPTGPPRTYLLAGAPALLGSLWDVTDGDTDKFAGELLENWGLLTKGSYALEEQRLAALAARARSEAQGRSGKKGGKQRQRRGQGQKETMKEGLDERLEGGRRRMQRERKGYMALSEACAVARKACHFRFLNGAAMVVYGVPVALA